MGRSSVDDVALHCMLTCVHQHLPHSNSNHVVEAGADSQGMLCKCNSAVCSDPENSLPPGTYCGSSLICVSALVV